MVELAGSKDHIGAATSLSGGQMVSVTLLDTSDRFLVVRLVHLFLNKRTYLISFRVLDFDQCLTLLVHFDARFAPKLVF